MAGPCRFRPGSGDSSPPPPATRLMKESGLAANCTAMSKAIGIMPTIDPPADAFHVFQIEDRRDDEDETGDGENSSAPRNR